MGFLNQKSLQVILRILRLFLLSIFAVFTCTSCCNFFGALNEFISQKPEIATAPSNITTVTPENKLPPLSPLLEGSWHGDACEQGEGTYLYRWQLDLAKDPTSGQIVGTLKFHKCPNGGRVLYRVVYESTSGSKITLAGALIEASGDLSASAPPNQEFTFYKDSVIIEPNLGE